MKRLISLFILLLLFVVPVYADTQADGISWSKLENGIVGTILYSLIGILMALLAYRMIDMIIPGKMSHQIAEDKNVAVALLASSMILGICIIIAAAIAN